MFHSIVQFDAAKFIEEFLKCFFAVTILFLTQYILYIRDSDRIAHVIRSIYESITLLVTSSQFQYLISVNIIFCENTHYKIDSDNINNLNAYIESVATLKDSLYAIITRINTADPQVYYSLKQEYLTITKLIDAMDCL